MKDAPNKDNAIRFLELLLGAEGTRSLKDNGPDPLTPAQVTPADLSKLPPSLRALLK
jgi:ABC-type Fe3+ transport system substrate-binding protein